MFGMDAADVLAKTRDNLTVKRVFGDPIESGGALIVPVAVVAGGGGAGTMEGTGDDGSRQSGGGFGTWTRPIGVYEIRDGRATFRPTIDVVPLAIVGAFVLRLFVRRIRRR